MWGVPNFVVYSCLTEVYCNGFAALLLVGCIAETECVVLFLGEFQRAVQYGMASHLAHDQIRSVCADPGALLPVPLVLIVQ